MKKIMSRFGEIEYDSKQVLHFVDGLIGFEGLHDYVVIPIGEGRPLFWIQSVEEAEVAFVLTDPTNFFLEYRVVPDESERLKLELDAQGECLNLAVVTVQQDKSITLNLQAPILYAPATDRALQVILEKTDYQSRTPLPVVKPPATQTVAAAE